MNLYSVDYNKMPCADDLKVWERLKVEEVVDRLGTLEIRRSKRESYPIAVRHFLSLFPNNFLDTVELRSNKTSMEESLLEFELLINSKDTTERNILNFINNKNRSFIIASILKDHYRFGHHGLYLFLEFRLGPNYKVDYLIVGANSDGYHFVFVELENPYGMITKSDGTFGEVIMKGIKQVDDWEEWLEKHFSSIISTFETDKKSGEILRDEFKYLDKTRLHYVVVAGKRQDFQERTYREQRKYLEESKIQLLHYNNLIDLAGQVIATGRF